jgi:hypothetical protein
MGLLDALTLRESDWPSIFGYNQIGIRTYASFIKNAITACGSLRFRKALDLLFHFTEHENDILRAYACWAVGRISGCTSKRVLELRYRQEKSGLVRREIESFL